jgi:hypothetical protein
MHQQLPIVTSELMTSAVLNNRSILLSSPEQHTAIASGQVINNNVEAQFRVAIRKRHNVAPISHKLAPESVLT